MIGRRSKNAPTEQGEVREIYPGRKALLEPGIENNGPNRGVTDQSYVSFHVY